MNRNQRLVVVSNRLPITLDDGEDGITAQASCGGLVSALLPVFREMGGCWIGWPGTVEYAPDLRDVLRRECEPDYSLEPVFLSAKDRALFYQGCANEIIWPLFHDLQSRCRFDPSFWGSYCEVNGKFADAIESVASEDDFIWVHDYHLMMVAQVLRERGVRTDLAYFHHVPFPSPDVFEKLPWRRELLEGLLAYKTVGFQSDKDRRNFFACVKRELGSVRLRRVGRTYELSSRSERTLLGTFPISIDFESFSAAARRESVADISHHIKIQCDGRKVILGIDRLDYTKGIQERLLGFASLLRSNPALRDEVMMIQVVVPSREEIQSYSDLRASIERQISEINGEFGSPDWCPITYMHKSLSNEELLGLYGAADVMLVTPLRDGMNLVAKEYCATRNDNSGVLVLSEFAGAAAELRSGALLVNPYDTNAVSAVIRSALQMDGVSKQRRMRQMRAHLRSHDVFNWCESFRTVATRTSSMEREGVVVGDFQRLTVEAS